MNDLSTVFFPYKQFACGWLFVLLSLGIPSTSQGAETPVTVANLSAEITDSQLSIAPSQRAELMELAAALANGGAISLSSAMRADAFAQTRKLASHPAIEHLRDLQRLGLNSDGWMALILAHEEPPKLNGNRPIDRWLPPWGTDLSSREKQKKLEKTVDALADFYKEAALDRYFEKYSSDYLDFSEALNQSLPRGEPVLEFQKRLALENHHVVLVPSVIANTNRVIPLFGEGGAVSTTVVIVALPDGSLPYDDAARASLRYAAVAQALLTGLFTRFKPEIEYTSHLINNSNRGNNNSSTIQVDLNGQSVMDADKLRGALTQALFLDSIRGQNAWELSIRASVSRETMVLMEAMADYLATAEGPLYTQIPALLEAAIASTDQQTADSRLHGGFEHWEAGKPVGWNVATSNSPRKGAESSTVSQQRDESRGSYLTISATANALQWQEAIGRAIPIQPGDIITVEGLIRTQDVTPNPGQLVGAHIFALLKSPQGALIRRVQGRPLTGTADWQKSSISIEIPAGSSTLSVGATLGMAGTADFDDISVSVKRPNSLHLLQYGGFELAGSGSPIGWNKVITAQNPVDGPSVDSVWNLSKSQAFQGNTSLELKGGPQTSTWYGMRSEPIRTHPGSRISLSGYTRAINVRREGMQQRSANLAIEFLDERSNVLSSSMSPITEGDSDWTLQNLEVTAPRNTVWLRVSCQLTESGTLQFDDLHLSQR